MFYSHLYFRANSVASNIHCYVMTLIIPYRKKKHQNFITDAKSFAVTEQQTSSLFYSNPFVVSESKLYPKS